MEDTLFALVGLMFGCALSLVAIMLIAYAVSHDIRRDKLKAVMEQDHEREYEQIRKRLLRDDPPKTDRAP
jgi:uncharacterized membrane protein